MKLMVEARTPTTLASASVALSADLLPRAAI